MRDVILDQTSYGVWVQLLVQAGSAVGPEGDVEHEWQEMVLQTFARNLYDTNDVSEATHRLRDDLSDPQTLPHVIQRIGDILARRKRRGFPSTAGTRSSGSVSRLALPASMGRVSTLGRERLVALSRALPSERVIAVDFQPTALTQSVEPRGSVSARFTPCRPKAINRASRAPQTWVECGPHPALVRNGMWRNPIETHVCGRLSGFGGVPAVPLAAVASRNGRDSRRRERRDSLAD